VSGQSRVQTGARAPERDPTRGVVQLPLARSRPAKKSDKQLDLPPDLPSTPAPPPTTKVLPMKLQIGDRFSTESGEREAVGRPYTSAGGKMVHARVQYMGQPATAVVWVWGAHERVAMKQAQ